MKLPIQKQILAAFFALVTLFFLPAFALSGQHRVIRIVDGDTLIVDYYGKAEKVRLLCVDTPESVHPDQSKNEPMGEVASGSTKAKLERQHVDLEFEGKRQRDRYNRLLA
jgi:micrococcal nuclease